MDLAKTVAHLAAANLGLTDVHRRTLGYLEAIYLERGRKRSCNSETITGESRKCRRQQKLALAKRKIIVTNKRPRKIKNSGLDNEMKNFNDESNELRDSENLEKIDRLSRKLVASESELETSRKERLTAEQRISSLEGSLDGLRLEGTKNIATLQAKLNDEVIEKRKHLKELDDAKKEISDLKRALRCVAVEDTGEKRSEDEQSVGVSDSTNPLGDVNEEFKKELLLKREARQRAIAAVSSEIDRLRRELEAEKSAHMETKELLKEMKNEVEIRSKLGIQENGLKTEKKTEEQVEALRLSDLLKISDEITNDMWLQLERTDDLRFQLENDPEEHRLRIVSLKRMSDDTRAMIKSRKKQINALKDRLAQILVRLGDRNFLNTSDDIRDELDRQIEDVGRSRTLSDERYRILTELKDNSFKELHQARSKIESMKNNAEGLEEELQKTEDKLSTRDSEILNLESQLGLTKADCRDLENQMSVINNLFSQMLLGASSAEMNLDRLTQLLQENHDLITEMAKENGREAAALPKLLLDIIKQVEGGSNIDQDNSDSEEKKDDESPEESIAHNLPKVWRVLLELLSCHAANTSASTAASASSASDSCYKSVDTPAGPRLVISVSKTYIRLKELILEKKHVEKEMNRMKQLNSHLESKLGEQEKRLLIVTDELSKTWNVVGRMQAQHQQLHTHEKILRYELQQKRKMLQELKQELEYCREKWESARQKNSKTEMEWKSLRREFAARKAIATHSDSFNLSGESGFSDERDEETDEEDELNRTRQLNSRKRPKKDDVSNLEPKSNSPSPSSSIEDDKCEEVVEDPSKDDSKMLTSSSQESLNSFDKALTSVIQNLIVNDENVLKADQSELGDDSPESTESVCDDLQHAEPVKCMLQSIKPIFTIGPMGSSQVQNVQLSEPSDVESSPASVDNDTIESPENLPTISPRDDKPIASCSIENPAVENKPEEAPLDARAARLKRLEEQASWLVKKMTATNRRGNELSTRLGELHETYGSPTPAPPPMPDVLPNFRLWTEATDDQSKP